MTDGQITTYLIVTPDETLKSLYLAISNLLKFRNNLMLEYIGINWKLIEDLHFNISGELLTREINNKHINIGEIY